MLTPDQILQQHITGDPRLHWDEVKAAMEQYAKQFKPVNHGAVTQVINQAVKLTLRSGGSPSTNHDFLTKLWNKKIYNTP